MWFAGTKSSVRVMTTSEKAGCLALGYKARIVFSRSRIFDVEFEMCCRIWIGEACFAQKVQMDIKFEASGLIVLGHSIWFDEINVYKHFALWKRLVTVRVDLGDRFAPTKIV